MKTDTQFARIGDGLIAQVVDRKVLPAHVTSASHEGLRSGCACRPLVEAMTRVEVIDASPDRGARAECQDRHDYHPWLRGSYGPRDLLLSRCAFCTAVEVRDRSIDILPGLAGSGVPRRRSDVLGWYSGSRVAARTYI